MAPSSKGGSGNVVTSVTHQPLRSRWKAKALENIPWVVVTLLTSHEPRGCVHQHHTAHDIARDLGGNRPYLAPDGSEPRP